MARRLQRSEYVNTVRDLLGVSFRPEADFPKDETDWHGSPDVPEIAALDLAKYRSAAQGLLDQAIAAESDREDIFGR